MDHSGPDLPTLSCSHFCPELTQLLSSAVPKVVYHGLLILRAGERR
jgi:hypothetical protein